MSGLSPLFHKIEENLEWKKRKVNELRKFFLAKYFEKLNSRKLIPAKCKNFENFPIHESFFLRKFLPLKYFKGRNFRDIFAFQ